jgi:hypothetical protein
MTFCADHAHGQHQFGSVNLWDMKLSDMDCACSGRLPQLAVICISNLFIRSFAMTGVAGLQRATCCSGRCPPVQGRLGYL